MYNYSYFRTLGKGEQSLVKWQFREHGGFWSSVWDAMCKADGWNLSLLERAFPDEVKAYRRYASEPGYWENILANLRRPEERATVVGEKENK